MKRIAIIAVLVLLLVGVAFAVGYYNAPPEIVQLPPLPPKTVEVEIVKEIPAPGPERVVERIKWRTKEVPVEVTKEVIQFVDRIVKGDADLSNLQGRVDVEADKFEGVDEGVLRFGWSGTAHCDVRDGGGPWTRLFSAPLSLESSSSVSTLAPQPLRRKFGWSINAGLGFYSTHTYDPQLERETRDVDHLWYAGTTIYPHRSKRFSGRVGYNYTYQSNDTHLFGVSILWGR